MIQSNVKGTTSSLMPGITGSYTDVKMAQGRYCWITVCLLMLKCTEVKGEECLISHTYHKSILQCRIFRCFSGKIWYLQHHCVGDTIVYH